MKKFKMNGFILGEQNVIRLMDHSLDTGKSIVIPAGIKKDGTLSKSSKVASNNEFDDLRHYVRNMYVKTGNAIIEGQFGLHLIK